MSRYQFLLVVLCAVIVASVASDSANSQTLATDCAPEIRSHCSTVTPGDSRIIACLIAYEDKISAECRLSVYLKSGSIAKRLTALKALHKVCWPFIRRSCSNVVPGGGRIYVCIKKNKATIDGDCRASIPIFEKMFIY